MRLKHIAGEVLEDLTGAHDLSARLGQRLPFFASEQVAELVSPREHLTTCAVEDLGALPGRGRRPRGGGLDGCGNRVLGAVGIDVTELAHHVSGVGGVEVGVATAASDLVAADKGRDRAHVSLLADARASIVAEPALRTRTGSAGPAMARTR